MLHYLLHSSSQRDFLPRVGVASLVLATVVLTFAGCGQKPAPPPPAPPATGGGPAPMPSVAMPSLETSANATAASAASPAPPPAAVDFAAVDRPFTPAGKPITDLEWLNQIVQGHLMRNATPNTTLPQGKYNSPDEQFAAEAAAMEKQYKSAPKLNDLSDLVKTGLIKNIPAAPPGKKYVLDQKSGTVLLVDLK